MEIPYTSVIRGYMIMAAQLTDIHPDTIAEMLGAMDWYLQHKTEAEATAVYEAFISKSEGYYVL